MKIYGERNSGNNYLIKLMQLNLDVDAWPNHVGHVYGWTHGFPMDVYMAGRVEEDFVVLIKNPYSWLLSLNKKPHHPKPEKDQIMLTEFSEFIRQPFEYWPNPVVMYRVKFLEYLRFSSRVERCVIIRFEDLIASPEKVIKHIASTFSLGKHFPFVDVKNYIHSTGKESEESFDPRREYYLNEEWKELISKDDKNFIDSILQDITKNYYGNSRNRNTTG